MEKLYPDKYEKLVECAIHKHTQFPVTGTQFIQTIRSTFFELDAYPYIKDLVEKRQWWRVKENSEGKKDFKEYLDIVHFRDGDDKKYKATVYNSDELWQDPEIMDIFLL